MNMETLLLGEGSREVGTHILSCSNSWENAINKAQTIFKLANAVEIGILKVEPLAKLPESGFSIHENSHEFGYVLEGNVIIANNEEEREIKEGEMFYNDPGTPHYTLNNTTKPSKVLWFLIPPLNN